MEKERIVLDLIDDIKGELRNLDVNLRVNGLAVKKFELLEEIFDLEGGVGRLKAGRLEEEEEEYLSNLREEIVGFERRHKILSIRLKHLEGIASEFPSSS